MGNIHELLRKHGLEEARKLLPNRTKNDLFCMNAAYEVLTDEISDMGLAHTGFAFTALPHRKTSLNIWRRESGNVKLLIEGGIDENDAPIGLPYGAMARMILLYLQTQAVRNQSRQVELGSNMNKWLSAMGISVGGKTYKLVKEQSYRISRCRLTFFTQAEGAKMVSNGAFVRDAIVSDADIDGKDWKEMVTLDEAFYESLIKHPLPLREIAIKQISGKSKALDIYIWLAYRLHALVDKVQISWTALKNQFGTDYKSVALFRSDFIDPLRLALAVYPEAQVEWDDKFGLTLYPSPSPVTKQIT